MASVKELRQRIKSVGSIKQITRAMEMVATTKLRRFQDRAIASRPYAQEIAGLVGRLAAVIGPSVQEMPLFSPRHGAATHSGVAPAKQKALMLVVSSDRGLCGAYNSNLFKELEIWRKEQPDIETEYFVYGRKAFQYMSKRGFDIKRYVEDPALEQIDYRNASIIARMLRREFETGEYNRIEVLYSAFESMAKYVPTVAQFLPIQADALGASHEHKGGDVLLEPDAETIFEHLIPRFLETRIYNSLLEALTSEYASRRFAMKNATDAANDMQDVLRGVYNRKRQENITKELLDIVGGAEAVK